MMKTKDKQANDPRHATLQGVVTARKCNCCGHHEMGITCDSGGYLALKPGMRVLVIEGEAEEP